MCLQLVHDGEFSFIVSSPLSCLFGRRLNMIEILLIRPFNLN